MLGVMAPTRAMIVGIMAAMVEFALSLVPAVVNTLTISYYLRSMVFSDSNDFATGLDRVIGEATTLESIGALLLGTVVCLAVACYVVRRKDYIEHAEV